MPRWDRWTRRAVARLDASGRLASGDAPTKEVPLHTALYQTRTSARAVVHLHSTPFGGAVDAAGDRPRAALPPMTAYYLMKCGATALVPYYRPAIPAVADAIKASPENILRCCWPITARWYRATRWKPRCSRSRSWKKPQSSICCCAASIRVT